MAKFLSKHRLIKLTSFAMALSPVVLTAASCSKKYPYSSSLKTALDHFNDTYIKKYSQVSASNTMSTYLAVAKNRSIFFQEALSIFGFASQNQFNGSLNVSDVFANLTGTNLTSWGDSAVSRDNDFKTIVSTIYTEYIGLILVTAASFRYQNSATVTDLEENFSDGANAKSYVGQYFYYLEKNSVYTTPLFSNNLLSYWRLGILNNFSNTHDLNSSFLNTLFTTNFSKSSDLVLSFDKFKSTDRCPNKISRDPVNYSFNAVYAKKYHFDFTFNFHYNIFATNPKNYYYQDLYTKYYEAS